MKEKQGRNRKNYLVMIGGFLIVFCLVFFGVQFITKTGLFRVPGIVIYDESLTEEEVAAMTEIFTEEIDLSANVVISAENTLELPELGEGEFLYEIYVPVGDFYDFETRITVNSVDELFTNCIDCSYRLISVSELTANQRLFRINEKYYLDDFSTGAVFRIVKFESERYGEEVAPLVAEAMQRSFPSQETVLTFAQTGVTALSRGMNAKLNQVGDAQYFAAGIGEYLSSFDLTHTSNESSFTNYATSKNICSDKRFINTLLAIGLDIVELTGNHNQDCGDTAARETIDLYVENGIKTVGGGRTADTAAVPLEIEEKGSNITMLAYNLSTGGATYDDTPGANQYYENAAAAQIKTAKERGDFVIVDVQYYECSSYDTSYENTACDYADSAAGDQIGFFRHLVDLGADVVVGTSAHQPQTFEVYGDGEIYYGLGNLFFDQVWWPGTTRSLVLVHHFYEGRLLQTEIVPTVYDSAMQTRIMDNPQWFLERLVQARPEAADGGNAVQAIINQWVRSAGGDTGVIFYDLDNSKILGQHNADKKFATASLYKLFVVYEGYRLVQNGEWNGNEMTGATGYTISKCLDLAIRESHSPCAETLWGMIGRDTLDNIVQSEFNIDVAVGSLSATPKEIMKIMKIYYSHNDISDENLVAMMKDSFLNQPATTYNWRQGLPSGFSDDVLVYNKVGWDWGGKKWTVYDDAAILEIPSTGRHYIIVVMTNGVTYQKIRELGKNIEKVIR